MKPWSKGGLIVCVGCGDPDLLVGLHARDTYLVQALDPDAEKVATAREQIKSEGIYGKVSADIFDGKRLPYAENLVNLLMCRAGSSVPEAELLRVLAPHGVVLIGRAAVLCRGVLSVSVVSGKEEGHAKVFQEIVADLHHARFGVIVGKPGVVCPSSSPITSGAG